MFKKTKEPVKKKKAVPKPQEEEPQEIEEFDEEEDYEEAEPKQPKKKDLPTEPEEEGEEELTEEVVKNYFANIARVLNDLNTRVARIEHHLRLDF